MDIKGFENWNKRNNFESAYAEFEKNFDLSNLENSDIQTINSVLMDLSGIRLIIDQQITKLHESVLEGINSKESTVFIRMPKVLKEEVKKWDIIFKSPYSNSIYSDSSINESYIPDGCLSISNHWNMNRDSKKYQKVTDKPVICDNHLTLCKFNKKADIMDAYIIKKEIREKTMNDEQIDRLKGKGVWEVIMSVPMDNTNFDKLNTLIKQKRQIKEHVLALRDIKMKKIQMGAERQDNISENKVEDGNVKKFNQMKDANIKSNMEYNFEPVDHKKYKNADHNYDIVISNKIEIGDPNSVQKFLDWCKGGQFWKKQKDLSKKEEPSPKQP